MAIITNRRRNNLVALSLVAPFLVIFALFFLYPFYRVVQMSFTDAPLLGGGEWVGLANYVKLLSDKLFYTAIVNNGYFVLLTVIPTTIIALGIALMVNRLKGRLQAFVLVIFFLPYVLPVSVVTEIWNWMLDFQYGILQPVIAFFTGKPVAVFRNPYWVMPVDRRGDDLVDQRLQRAALHRRPAQHLRPSSTRPPPSTAPRPASSSGASPGRSSGRSPRSS